MNNDSITQNLKTHQLMNQNQNTLLLLRNLPKNPGAILATGMPSAIST